MNVPTNYNYYKPHNPQKLYHQFVVNRRHNNYNVKTNTTKTITVHQLNNDMPDEITDIDLTTVRQYMDYDDAWEALSKQGVCTCI